MDDGLDAVGPGLPSHHGIRRGIIVGMTVKTAISIEESLYRQAEKLAEEMAVSRSQVFAIALQTFLRQRQNQTLLQRLNEAYAEPDTASEKKLRRAWRRKHRGAVTGEW